MFLVSPLWFFMILLFPYWFWKENQRKTIGKPIPADSGTSPELPSGPLPPLSQPALGLLLRDFPWVSPCRLACSELLWLALAPSFLSLPFTRNKEEIWLWGFLLDLFFKGKSKETNRTPSPADSGASSELLCLCSCTCNGEDRVPFGLLCRCSGLQKAL